MARQELSSAYCWIKKKPGEGQKGFEQDLICRWLSKWESCTLASLHWDPPATLDDLYERLEGVDDAKVQEEGPTQVVVVCTFPRSRKKLAELKAFGPHKPGRCTFVLSQK